MPEITHMVNLSMISIIGFQKQEFSYPFGQMAGPITSYVRFPIEAESKSTFKLKVNNLQIQKALTLTAKAFAAYAADVK